ncbi:hypothetical protein GCM10011529_15670 [Polymorphobacter glacialis]|uniref:DUF4281 domain-containing protein n=1 Tax=Sandarakinorhabdus glacialis TaxID=1614636 RepID=A0A917E6S1_9SPHN|nr:ABA4-like family protein [Polymorphobacter glacialis]GGE10176.1 hypothetical protein GCM10011529_15670 [Polymorphobacter glacialis]
MDLETLFSIASAVALAGWVMLVLAPLRRPWAVAGARIVAVVLCGGYLSLVAAGLAGDGMPAGSGFDTLAGVRLLLSTPAALLAGWVHYLAFDLFVGSWQVEDAPAAGIPHWLVVPCLVLTFMAGPVGLFVYFIIRTLRNR